MKKLTALLLAAVLALSLCSCGAPAGPDGVVKTFCESAKKLDLEAMHSCVNTDESFEDPTAGLNLEDENVVYLLETAKKYAGQLEYTIGEPAVSENGQNGMVDVEFTCPTLVPVLGSAAMEYMGQAFGQMLDQDELTEEEQLALLVPILKEKLESAVIETETVSVTFTCVNLEDGWKIEDTEMEELLSVLTGGLFDFFSEL